MTLRETCKKNVFFTLHKMFGRLHLIVPIVLPSFGVPRPAGSVNPDPRGGSENGGGGQETRDGDKTVF